MACDRWQAKLDTYLDGELPPEEARAFDAHLHSCPACAAESLAHVQMKRAIHAAGRRFTPTTEFRNRVQQRIAGKPRRALGWSWEFATAVVAILVIAGLGTTYILRQRLRTEQVYSELADLHVATLASSTPVDVVSTDRHTVKPWFTGKIPFTFNLPELQNSDFSLVGGRVTYLGQTPGAHLIYQVRKHQISVFIFQDRLGSGLSGNASVRRHASFSVETWSQGGLRYFVLGDAAPEDIDRLSELFKKAAG
ncbi:MAG TPA: anti-sigma factor [Terriglobales bacterium]|nr:anti-sigma factor [Terriglobales bacterium]